jgi:hypothetical protein
MASIKERAISLEKILSWMPDCEPQSENSITGREDVDMHSTEAIALRSLAQVMAEMEAEQPANLLGDRQHVEPGSQEVENIAEDHAGRQGTQGTKQISIRGFSNLKG